MISLYFVLSKFPRTINRKQWREIWRWKRLTQKQLAVEVSKQLEMLGAYGSTTPDYIRQDMLDNMINPPLLVHDRMDISYNPKDVI